MILEHSLAKRVIAKIGEQRVRLMGQHRPVWEAGVQQTRALRRANAVLQAGA